MKQLLYLLLTVTLFSSCFTNRRHQVEKQCDYSVKVVGISDGDTFKGVTDDSTIVRFRIYGIDAPETKQAYSQKSKQYLSDLIFNKRVNISVQKPKDRYGRPIVWVYTPDGKDVSAEMLKAGLAWHYKEYDKSDEYANFEKVAKKNKKGLWQDNNPTAPWDFRKNARNKRQK
ncbi:micrococcal nuclease [Dysgonomonadaceae bacterium PH5-43]|nr:micrococcal nuclease [Dysgonomonadaceae bacterium PH5-43]